MSQPLASAVILIVDDRTDTLPVLNSLLGIAGYQVRQLPTANVTIETIQAESPDLILLSSQLPQMSGYEICQQLKGTAATRDVPVLFLATLEAEADKIRGFEAGGIDYLTPPFLAAEVLARVQTHLSLRYLQQQLQLKNALLEQETSYRQQLEEALGAAQQDIQRLDRVDALTRLANRRYGNEYLEQEWRRQAREWLPLSLILVDVDCFKQYNDIYGLAAGDDCLRQIAIILQSGVKRPADLVVRYAGEKFAIILPNTTEVGAVHIATKLQTAIKKLNIPHGGSSISSHITLSMGVACLVPLPDTTFSQLMINAERALQQAKSDGRDRVIAESTLFVQ